MDANNAVVDAVAKKGKEDNPAVGTRVKPTEEMWGRGRAKKRSNRENMEMRSKSISVTGVGGGHVGKVNATLIVGARLEIPLLWDIAMHYAKKLQVHIPTAIWAVAARLVAKMEAKLDANTSLLREVLVKMNGAGS